MSGDSGIHGIIVKASMKPIFKVIVILNEVKDLCCSTKRDSSLVLRMTKTEFIGTNVNLKES